jgi:glycerol-3-phosphate acyltransferase PlsX
MGGDHAPAYVVDGAFEALGSSPHPMRLLLVGRRQALEPEMHRYASTARAWEIVEASQVIEMGEAPNEALRSKKDSSISVGLQLVRQGKAGAFVSAGNTGAVLSASTLILGRLPGVGRPTIGTLLPTTGSPCLLVDAGANVDCRPRHLFEFGAMGAAYMSTVLGLARPRIGLLNIGEEEGKGNEATQEAYRLFRSSPLEFAGNIEGRDILRGVVDVVVCDGFVGNVILKFGESIPAFLKARFTEVARRSLAGRLMGLVARSGLRTVMRDLDYQHHGGVPLLGVNGISIIGHGGSTPLAFKNMIFRAEELVRKQLPSVIQQHLQNAHA